MENNEKRKALVYLFDTETLLKTGSYRIMDDELLPLFKEMQITRDIVGAQDIIIVNYSRNNSLAECKPNSLLSNRKMIESWYSLAKTRRFLEDNEHRVVLGRCFYNEGFATFAEPNGISDADLFVAHPVDGRQDSVRLLEYIDSLATEYDIRELIAVNSIGDQSIEPLIDPPLYEGIPVTLYSTLAISEGLTCSISVVDLSGTVEIEAHGEPIKNITRCAHIHNWNMKRINYTRRQLGHQKKYILSEGKSAR